MPCTPAVTGWAHCWVSTEVTRWTPRWRSRNIVLHYRTYRIGLSTYLSIFRYCTKPHTWVLSYIVAVRECREQLINPEAEVIYLVKFFYDITYLSLYLRCGPLAWAHNIRYVICYVKNKRKLCDKNWMFLSALLCQCDVRQLRLEGRNGRTQDDISRQTVPYWSDLSVLFLVPKR